MTMLECTRLLEFCAGHRVMGHEGKCRHIHGHNYLAEIRARSIDDYDPLDRVGRVVDFSVLKQRVGGWIDENWDHKFIACERDSVVANAVVGASGVELEAMPVFWLPDNPTAENLAQYLIEVVCPEVLQGYHVEVVHVRLWETKNCYADATIEGEP